MLLKYVYIVFIGILLSIFIGVGIAAFYEGPKQPDQNYIPRNLYSESEKDATKSAELEKIEAAQNKEWQEFSKKTQEYNKNVSIIAVIASILILVISLTLFKKILLIADGLLLGGVLTLLYAIIRSFNSQDFKYIFVVVSIGLLTSLILGYLKFIKPQSKK